MFGALAKAVATLVTYPLQVAQTILRKHNSSSSSSNSPQGSSELDSKSNAPRRHHHHHPVLGTFGVLMKLFRSGGIPAMYTGVQMKFVQTVLT